MNRGTNYEVIGSFLYKSLEGAEAIFVNPCFVSHSPFKFSTFFNYHKPYSVSDLFEYGLGIGVRPWKLISFGAAYNTKSLLSEYKENQILMVSSLDFSPFLCALRLRFLRLDIKNEILFESRWVSLLDLFVALDFKNFALCHGISNIGNNRLMGNDIISSSEAAFLWKIGDFMGISLGISRTEEIWVLGGGIEVFYTPNFRLRCGIKRDKLAFGIGFSGEGFRLDLGVRSHRFLGPSQMISLSYTPGFFR